jgi:transcriptional repressor NrdR
MKCPYCASSLSKVTNKRESPNGIRRRRECLRCRKRYTTYERIEPADFYVIKKDGRREKFSRDKLERGIEKAFEKRPVSKERIDRLIQDVEDALRKKGRKEVKTTLIGDLVMAKIKRLDKVAYVRFASVYRDFEDIQDFRKVLKQM